MSSRSLNENEKEKEKEKQGDDEELAYKASWSHRFESARIHLKKKLSSHFIGILYSELLLYLSIFSTGQFVYCTYVNMNDGSLKSYYLNLIEMFLAALFCFDWILSFFLADHKLEFVTR
jgi:hypothetical protein